MPEQLQRRSRLALVGLTATYAAAFTAGILLVGWGAYAWWQARAERVVAPAEAVEVVEPLPEDITVATTDGPASAAPVVPAARKSAIVSKDLDCTDLRALFGLGENLTEAQKDFLQKNC
jgi:hypothetical protein